MGHFLAAELSAAYPHAALFGTTYGAVKGLDSSLSMALMEADLRDPVRLRQVIAHANPTHVFHLAGFASAAGMDTALMYAANVDTVVTLVTALQERKQPCRLHLASTGYVYGTTQPGRPAAESHALHPEGVYAQSKARMEEVIAPLARDYVSLTVTRAFNQTGPRQTPVFVVPGFARQLARIEKGLEAPLVRVGNLEAKRDFLDVRDAARAYRLLLCELDPVPWRVVNVASGESVTIQSVLECLIAQAQVSVEVQVDPERLRPSDMPDCVGDPTLLCALTGWRKSIPFTDTLRETLDWWRSQE